eukprot:scaffold160776_cov22-Tisochrysis_lutea.AAC.2
MPSRASSSSDARGRGGRLWASSTQWRMDSSLTVACTRDRWAPRALCRGVKNMNHIRTCPIIVLWTWWLARTTGGHHGPCAGEASYKWSHKPRHIYT